MPISDSPVPTREDVSFDENRLARNKAIRTEALRRRVLLIADRRLPAIILAARYEELDELIDIFFSFGSPEAMRLESAAGETGTPGLTLEESNALVRFRIQRGECYMPSGIAAPETPAPASLAALPAAATPSAVAPAEAAPQATSGLYRIFKNGRMWFIDRTTGKIVSEAPL